MGGNYYNRDLTTSFLATNRNTAGGIFKHTAAIHAGTKKAVVHDSLDPKKKNKAGQIVREAFDSADHPNSVPIAVLFDVTGSMAEVPKTLIEKLGDLMGFLVKNGIVPHPQLLFGAIGDAHGDAVPLQIGQFESDNTMDSVLANIYLEGRGQSNYQESYELGMYFMARHVNMDALNKRNKKGYLIFIGDEKPYDRIKREDVRRIIGVDLEEDISVEAILNELNEKFEMIWIFPNGSNYFGARGQEVGIHDRLKNLFGQRLVWLEDPTLVCETIANFIALNEGLEQDEVDTALQDIGINETARNKVSKSLAIISKNRNSLAKRASVEGNIVLSGSSLVERI